MFAYTLPDGLPSGSRTVWSQSPLQPLTSSVLTPFSYSVLEEIARGAWYQYYDELGFEPMPRARVLRRYEGRTYLNLTISAQREAEVAAIEPLTLLINERPFPLVKWEKPGLLAGIKAGRQRKKVTTLLTAYGQAVDAITQKAAAWYFRTQELRWSQADVLQIMEEIERVGQDSFKLFFSARHNLALIYNRLLGLIPAQQPLPAKLALLQGALSDLTALTEYQIAEALVALGEIAGSDPATVTWLQLQDFANWQQTLPNKQLVDACTDFIHRYGHRGVNEAEIEQLRWHEDPTLLFTSIQAAVQQAAKQPVKASAPQQLQRLLATVAAAERAEAEGLINQARQLMQRQSEALHAFAYILAGTRRWALAAAKEAMADGRLQQIDDLFFFELEEIKQMMTGEWNVSALREIHNTCQQRRAEFAQWQRLAPPPLLIGESAAVPQQQGLPGSSGQTSGPFHHCAQPTAVRSDGAIVGAQQLDSGWSMILPFAQGLIAANGAPLDPIVAAARSWHVPIVLGLGARYGVLMEGAQTTIDGDSGIVMQ